MKQAEKTRFSVTMKEREVQEIDSHSEATGIPRNELIRRAVLSFVRFQSGKVKDIVKGFREVGSIDQEGSK